MSAKMNHEELVKLCRRAKSVSSVLLWTVRMQMIIWSGAGHTVRTLRMNRLSSMWNRRTSSRWTVR